MCRGVHPCFQPPKNVCQHRFVLLKNSHTQKTRDAACVSKKKTQQMTTKSCASCSTELEETYKFCFECGMTADGVKRECVTCQALLREQDKYCSHCGKSTNPETAVANPAPTTPFRRLSATLADKLGDRRKLFASTAKSGFQGVKASPKCEVCTKPVYGTEKVLDASGRVFHRECFKCKTCGCSLASRQRVMEPRNRQSIKVTTGQYLMVGFDDSRLGNKEIGRASCRER